MQVFTLVSLSLMPQSEQVKHLSCQYLSPACSLVTIIYTIDLSPLTFIALPTIISPHLEQTISCCSAPGSTRTSSSCLRSPLIIVQKVIICP